MNFQDIFKDNKGKIVIAQKPNLPIIVWFFSFIISLLPLAAPIKQAADLIAFGSLFTWAWLEIFEGVNLWRRILGTTVMITLLALRINL